jgi:hypothetical protein
MRPGVLHLIVALENYIGSFTATKLRLRSPFWAASFSKPR